MLLTDLGLESEASLRTRYGDSLATFARLRELLRGRASDAPLGGY